MLAGIDVRRAIRRDEPRFTGPNAGGILVGNLPRRHQDGAPGAVRPPRSDFAALGSFFRAALGAGGGDDARPFAPKPAGSQEKFRRSRFLDDGDRSLSAGGWRRLAAQAIARILEEWSASAAPM